MLKLSQTIKTGRRPLNSGPVVTPKTSNMYGGTETWNPFHGCEFNCTYCVPSFKRQAKRRKRDCMKCYDFAPHEHPGRLAHLPAKSKIFVCGNSDLSFCRSDYLHKIVARINEHSQRCPHKVFHLQSKRPSCFAPFLGDLPGNVTLGTTLETNRDTGYCSISKAPVPSERFRQFKSLAYPRKIITIEPLLDLDVDVFAGWLLDINPEAVWIGFNSKPKSIALKEPSADKVEALMARIAAAGIEIRGKSLRGIQVPAISRQTIVNI